MLARKIDIQDRIISLVKSILQQNAITAEVDNETPLVDLGLNSVDLVNLMLSVESAFDLTIPQAEINLENFRSIASLKQLIAAQLHAR